MSSTLSVAVAGIGGWGQSYVDALLADSWPQLRCVGLIDPAWQRSSRVEQFQARKIPAFESLERFYATAHADLMILATPIHLHRPQIELALAKGSHVFCEKPLAPTVQDCDALTKASRHSSRHVAIGFQWSFSSAIQTLKQAILTGRFGAPLRLKTMVSWPRDFAYYRRNSWAGALRTPDGAWVLDSPINNATAHYLHNMCYCLGSTLHSSAEVVSIQGELYRANDISNYDTAALRATTAQGVELFMLSSHAAATAVEPLFEYVFEAATVRYNGSQGTLIVDYGNGAQEHLGSPDQNAHNEKIARTIEAIQQGLPSLCGIEAAAVHTRCVNGLQRSSAVHPFASTMVTATEGAVTVSGLNEALAHCYQSGQLFSEAAYPWAQGGAEIDLTALTGFDL